VSYANIIKDIKQKKFAPVYLLHGEESYYIDRISDAILEHSLEEHEKDFNLSILYGKETDITTIVAEAKGYPMMAERRVVIVREAQELKRKLPDLLPYVENPQPSTVLVICHKHSSFDGRSKLSSAINKKGVVFKSDKVRDYQLQDYIQGIVKELGYDISHKACSLLAESIGADLSRIHNELNKLSILIEKGQTINDVHIEENIGISKDYNNFELVEAVGKRDVPKAMRIVDYYDKNPKSGNLIMITSTLFGLFSKLMRLHFTKGSDAEAMKAAKITHPFILKQYRQYQKIYPPKKINTNIGLLHEYDLKSKGLGNREFSDMELAKELLFKLMH
jgi:DNA polymerase-3 subunit delta